MNAGAVQHALCKREGCNQPVRARRLCNKHYQQLQASAAYVPDQVASRRAIMACLPARVSEIAQEAGVSTATVRRHLKAAKKDRKVYIKRFDPPSVTGAKFQAVWARGWSDDAVFDPNQRRRDRQDKQNKRRAMRRIIEAAREASKASWMTPLYMPKPAREDQHG